MFALFLLLSLFMTNITCTHEVFKKLDERMVRANSLVCVGLDPDLTKIPLVISNTNRCEEDKVYLFLTQIIDIAAPHTCCFKVQKAFYDQFNLGHDLLKSIVAYIHKYYADIPVFIDCKIGDTDNTMKAYMKLLFEDIKADGVVINPYMGDDVLESFVQDQNKVGIVLIQTSNPNAKSVQELKLSNGKKLWEEVLALTIHRWNKNKNLIVVLSSNTDARDYSEIREQIPQDTPILLAGIGSQGGNPSVMKQLLNKDNRGVFVNSSRGILYPYDPSDDQWESSVLKAVIELKDALNNIRTSQSVESIVAQGKFLLLMGPSGTGKSTLIRHLKKMDDRFVYITPLTTRDLREGECDKIHVSLTEIQSLQEAEKLLTINNIYGSYYATPKHIIDDVLAQGKFPILDWPIDKLDIMERTYGKQLYKVYIQPDDLDELKRRLLQDNRDKDGKRYEAGAQEIDSCIAGKYDALYNLKLVNPKDRDQETAEYIYREFLNSLSN